jgi:hypothetical protein
MGPGKVAAAEGDDGMADEGKLRGHPSTLQRRLGGREQLREENSEVQGRLSKGA